MYVPINIAGGTYKHRARSLSAQVTRNFWPQAQEREAASEYILESPPGLSLFSAGSTSDRGMFAHRGILYKVSGTTLHSINSAGVRTNLGTITGSNRCIFDALEDTVIIVSSGTVWTWNGSTLTQETDADFESPDSVTVINQQALYDGDDDRFCVSDVGAPGTINGLNYATAESRPDKLIRPYAFNQNVYMFGENSLETWWNSGEGQPPFDRVQGGVYEVGLAALNSVSHNANAMYWLADDKNVYRLSSGGIDNRFTPHTLVREFSNYSTVADAIGWCMTYHKQDFYFLKFPSANTTWVYPEGGEWFQMSSSAYESGATAGRYMGNSYAFVYDKHLVADETGNVLEMDEDTFTDNGDTIKRIRDLSPIHGGLVGQPGKDIFISNFELIMETGVGTVSSADPKVALSFSSDGGRTFGTEYWNDAGDVGVAGDYLKSIRWAGLNVVGKNIVARLTTSADVYFSLHAAGADMDIGI